MMRHIGTTVLALGLALSGCGGGGEKAQDAAAVAGPTKREAGSWKTDIKLVKLDMPGLPPEMKDGMSKMMEGASGMEVCLTPEQAAKEDIAQELSKGPSSGGECTFSKKDVNGGKIDVAGKCKDQSGRELDIAMQGTVEAKKTDVTMTMTGPMPTGNGKMEMVMQVNSVHTGACKS